MLRFTQMVKYTARTIADITQTDTTIVWAKASPFLIHVWHSDVARTVMCDAWIIMIAAQIVI